MKAFKQKVSDRFKDWPKYCKLDGNELLDSENLIGYFFDTQTGKHIEKFKLFRYCPNWKESRDSHTEYWGREETREAEPSA